MKATTMRFLSEDKLGLVCPFHSLSTSADPDPQSGKTIFLLWVLLRRLTLRLPTALQIFPDEAVLFHEGGTAFFQNLTDSSTYLGLEFANPQSKIWVLVDSNNALDEPTGVFRMGRPFFVLQIASRETGLDCANKFYFDRFYMRTWTLAEVLQAYETSSSCVHDTH